MEVERRLGFEPIDREFEKLGYDIESRDPAHRLAALPRSKGPRLGSRHHHSHQERNSLLLSISPTISFSPSSSFSKVMTHRVHYVRRPFQREPDFGVTSVNYDFAELLARAEQPA